MIDTGIPDTYQIRSGDGLFCLHIITESWQWKRLHACYALNFFGRYRISETLYIVINASGSLKLI